MSDVWDSDASNDELEREFMNKDRSNEEERISKDAFVSGIDIGKTEEFYQLGFNYAFKEIGPIFRRIGEAKGELSALLIVNDILKGGNDDLIYKLIEEVENIKSNLEEIKISANVITGTSDIEYNNMISSFNTRLSSINQKITTTRLKMLNSENNSCP